MIKSKDIFFWGGGYFLNTLKIYQIKYIDVLNHLSNTYPVSKTDRKIVYLYTCLFRQAISNKLCNRLCMHARIEGTHYIKSIYSLAYTIMINHKSKLDSNTVF